MSYRVALSLCLSAALSTAAAAQDLPKTQVKVIGLNSPTPVSIYDEVPFWRKTIPEASKGAITADITPLDQMSIDDKTMLRLLKLGVMDFAAMDISKMAGDDPRFEACDLAGLTLDPDKARAACDAYRAVIDRQMQKNWNAKLLAFGGNTPQVFWCREVISGLDGFKGKKVRVFNNTMRDFLAGVGATAVSMAFAEVVPALSAGVVDCGVTGSLSGNTAGWNEVTKSIYPMSLGWSINVLAVNLDTWKRFDPKVQAFLLEQVKAYEDKMWATIKTTTRRGGQLQHRQAALHHGQARQVHHRGGEARGGRDAQEAGRGRGARRLGQALRRRMRQGVERHRRQGARSDGADAVRACRSDPRSRRGAVADGSGVGANGALAGYCRGHIPGRSDRRRRHAADRLAGHLRRHHLALYASRRRSAAPMSCRAMPLPSPAPGASPRRCSPARTSASIRSMCASGAASGLFSTS